MAAKTTLNGDWSLLGCGESVGASALELGFQTEALRNICEKEKIAKKRLGASVADALKRRLADLQSIDSVDELPLAKPKKNSNNCTIDLTDGWRLVLAGGHGQNPTLSSGKIDWSQVTRVKIITIEKQP